MTMMSSQSFNIVQTARKCIPLYTNRFVLYELTDRDRNWYTDQIIAPFFNNNIKNKFDQSDALDNAVKFLNHYFEVISTDEKNCLQLRMVIKDFKSSALVGGITVFYKEKLKAIDLGYWVIPKYQGNGIMGEVLREFLIALDKNLDTSFAIHLEIFDNNEASKSLAIKNRFFEMRRRSDSSGRDIILYGMDRKKFRVMVNNLGKRSLLHKNSLGGKVREEGSQRANGQYTEH